MRPFNAPSRCSGGQAVGFRWYGFPTCEAAEDKDLEVATEAFFTALDSPGRVWNPHSRTMAKMEFQRRVQKAGRGELEPLDEVKPVDEKNPPPLYEIRWQTIGVTTRVDGVTKHAQTIVRLYHSEPTGVPTHFVGHHIHEKLISDDTWSAQNAEIEIAKAFYHAGESTLWGIARQPKWI